MVKIANFILSKIENCLILLFIVMEKGLIEGHKLKNLTNLSEVGYKMNYKLIRRAWKVMAWGGCVGWWVLLEGFNLFFEPRKCILMFTELTNLNLVLTGVKRAHI